MKRKMKGVYGIKSLVEPGAFLSAQRKTKGSKKASAGLIPQTSADNNIHDRCNLYVYSAKSNFSHHCCRRTADQVDHMRYRIHIMKDNSSNPVIPLPFPVYFWAVVMLAVMGLADAIYLSISHYRVYTDIGYASFCAISKAINCDTVSQSPYSILWGAPVPVWGVFGYLCVLVLLPFAGSKEAGKERLWSFLFWIFLGFSLYSLALGLISALYIHSYCLMCIVSYAINFLLLFYAWLIRRRFGKNGLIADLLLDIRFLWHQKRPQIMVLTLVFGAVFLVMITKFPAYWHLTPPPLSESIPTGVTEDGHPWIGANAPVLEITEFTDYQCFQCKKMHFFLRRLIEPIRTKSG